jgi:hypothetical protein
MLYNIDITWCQYSGFAEIAEHRVDEFEGLVDFLPNLGSSLAMISLSSRNNYYDNIPRRSCQRRR